MTAARVVQEKAGFSQDFGLQIEFESFPDIGWALADHSFDRRNGIELLSTRVEGNITYARVFVPDGKLPFFEKQIQDYLNYKKDSRGYPRDNRTFIDTIKSIRTATLKALWTDTQEAYPSDPSIAIWWEVWLPVRNDRRRILATMTRQARVQGMLTLDYSISFPERTVTLIKATRKQMEESMMLLNMVAELRRAKDTADFFVNLTPKEQAEWKEDLLRRANIAKPQRETAYICILDTGVNRGHPLLADVLAAEDMDSVEPDWGVDDKEGHGTNMAGLAVWGDLYEALLQTGSTTIYHHLESVKLLSHDGGNEGESRFHGLLTREAVSRADVSAPYRKRVFQLAITAGDGRDLGRPSAWSSMIDELSYGDDPRGGRLFIISAGNISEPNQWQRYPRSNSDASVQDPAQAWNALTVGAYTEMMTIDEEDAADYRPVAAAGELSPYSRTSVSWNTAQWPIKPDVVMEGGNRATDALGPVQSASLSLLTTHHKPTEKLFTTANATSAASALVSRLAAQIMTEYPTLNPVTVRGLIIHSAQWTDAMKAQFFNKENPQKRDYACLVRHCGFGVPDLQRALWSVSITKILSMRPSWA
jgi:hypothetical protein